MPKVLTSSYLDEDVEIDDGTWYTLRGSPHFCVDCQRVQDLLHLLVTDRPLIVIFEEKDDEVLLNCAIVWQRENRNPKIIEYHPDMGTSITIDDVRKIVGENDRTS